MRKTIAMLVAATLLTGCGSGCGGTPYKGLVIGYETLNNLARLTERFDEGVNMWAKAKDAECTKKYGAKTAEYAKCIDTVLKFLRAWHGKIKGEPTGKGILPAIQSAQKITRRELNAAHDYVKAHEEACKGGDKKCNAKIEAWKAALKPGVCGLKEAVDRGIKLGAYKVTQDPLYKLVMGFADLICGK